MYSPQVRKHTINITRTKIGNFVEPSKFGTTMAYKKDVGTDKWYVYKMQNGLHEYWHIVGCPNLFCKLTNKLKAFMHSTVNLLHVQVAPMLAFVFWDSIGKKFERLPIFLTFPQAIWIWDWLGLTNLGQNAKNLDLQLQFHFAVCILHFTKFAGGKNRLF